VVFWWYPLAWLARRECRRATERCCDDWVLNWFPESAQDYAATLLKSVDFVSSAGQGMPGVIHGIGEFTTMKKRIVLILKNSPSPSLSRPVKGGLGLIAMVAILAGVKFIQSHPGEASRKAGAAERPVVQKGIVDVPRANVPRAKWKPGDVAFVIHPTPIRGEGDAVTTLRRGTGLQIQQATEDTLSVKEPQWGTGDTAGSIEQRSVGTASEALEIFSGQIRQDPNDAGAFTARGNVRRHEKEIDLAIEDFNEAIRLDPQDAIAYLNRSRAWSMDESEKKLADLTEAIRLDSRLKMAYRIRLGVHLSEQNFDKAGADCERILQLNPEDALALSMRGLIEIAKNNAKNNDGDIAEFTQAIQRAPNDPQPYLKRAEAYRAIGTMPGPQPHLERPETARERGRNDSAIADYSAAIRLDPKLEKAWRRRGEIWFERREFDLAIADFTAAIAIDPRSVKAIYRRGLSRSEKKEFEKSIADFTEVIRLEPKHSEAYKHRGYAWERIQNDDQAIEDYTTTIGLPPSEFSLGIRFGARNEPQPHTDISSKRYAFLYGRRGALLEKRLEYEKASADYADSLRHDPKDRFANRQLAWLLATCPEARYRNGEKAVEHAVIACQQNHWREASDLDALAAAYAETGQFEKAVASQQRACKMAPGGDPSSDLSRLDLYKTGKPFRTQPTKITDRDKAGRIK
jgi:tetratricopeptide (TPR) repeat protein